MYVVKRFKNIPFDAKFHFAARPEDGEWVAPVDKNLSDEVLMSGESIICRPDGGNECSVINPDTEVVVSVDFGADGLSIGGLVVADQEQLVFESPSIYEGFYYGNDFALAHAAMRSGDAYRLFDIAAEYAG